MSWFDLLGNLGSRGIFAPPGENIYSVTLLDHDTLCLVCGFEDMSLYEIATGKHVRSFECRFHFPRAFCSPEGGLAIVVEQGDPMGFGTTEEEHHRVAVLDLERGTERPFPREIQQRERIYCAAFSPDSQTVAIGTDSGRVALFPRDAIEPAR